MRRLLMALAIGSSALVAGCAGSGRATYAVSASTYSQPDLAYVSPGVYVVADYEQPVFYTNNAYYRYDSGRWYSSNYYNRGWRYTNPPRALVTIERPQSYVRYRPAQRYTVRANGRVQVRDQRDYRRNDNRRDNRYYRR